MLTQGGLLAFLPFVAVFGFLLLRSFSLWRAAGATGRAAVGEFGAILLATLVSYWVMIGTFDAINSQYANIVLFFIVGILVARMEGCVQNQLADHRSEAP